IFVTREKKKPALPQPPKSGALGRTRLLDIRKQRVVFLIRRPHGVICDLRFAICDFWVIENSSSNSLFLFFFGPSGFRTSGFFRSSAFGFRIYEPGTQLLDFLSYEGHSCHHVRQLRPRRPSRGLTQSAIRREHQPVRGSVLEA